MEIIKKVRHLDLDNDKRESNLHFKIHDFLLVKGFVKKPVIQHGPATLQYCHRGYERVSLNVAENLRVGKKCEGLMY